MQFCYEPIGFLRTPYPDPASIPKAFGAVPTAEGRVEILPEFSAGLLGIDSFSHLILIVSFHLSREKPLQVIPPTKTEARGVFSSRSPERPNAIGLATVRLLKRQERILYVQGVDFADGTPVLDIKPYLLHFDCRPEATVSS
jgi:tRNA-Thr(GGU) m(6)t(6)A37 methyltransferase TsaA